jgi:hypothetical protein
MGTQYLQDINAIDEGYGDFQSGIDIYGRGWSWGGQAASYGGIGNPQTQYPWPPVQMLCPQILPVFYLETDYEIQGWLAGDCAEPFNDVLENYLALSPAMVMMFMMI